MTIDGILNLQYRKLLTLQNNVKARFFQNGKKLLSVDMKLIEALSIFMIDLENLNYPEIDEDEKNFLEPMIRSLEENPTQNVKLTHAQRQKMIQIARTHKISDEWNKIIALAFVDYHNDIVTVAPAGKTVIEKIFEPGYKL